MHGVRADPLRRLIERTPAGLMLRYKVDRLLAQRPLLRMHAHPSPLSPGASPRQKKTSVSASTTSGSTVPHSSKRRIATAPPLEWPSGCPPAHYQSTVALGPLKALAAV